MKKDIHLKEREICLDKGLSLLLRAGVPVTIVQDLLGHSALTTTAIYLKISGQEAKGILREKGLI